MAAIASCRAAPTPALSSAEDAAKKKSTDCVYFLASPLTCKKGAECEFRHSESARTNPRDCWFWLSGNCYNRGCPFRHPPLDARPEAGGAAPAPAPAPTPAAPPVSNNNNKSRPPCYYFAQGYCAKGERCSFMHALAPIPAPKPAPGPQIESAPKTQHQPEAAPKVAPKIELKNAPAAQPRAPPAEATKPATRKPEPAVTRRPEPAVRRPENNVAPQRQAPRNRSSPAALREEERSNNHNNNNSMNNRNSSSEPESSTHELEEEEIRENGGRDENSPGFDVLVDDGPDEQLHYMDEGEYHLHNERFDDDPPFLARRGGGGGGFVEREFDRRVVLDYDRPHHDQVGNLERDYYKKSGSIKDRLVFNGGETRPQFLASGDLRNVLERRKFRGEQRLQRIDHHPPPPPHHHHHHQQQQQQLQQRRFVQRVAPPSSPPPPGERRLSQERGFASRAGRVEARRGGSSPPVYEMNPGSFNFEAPKSLAQIRAEKRKPERAANGAAKRVQREAARGGGDDEFEAPKPLREILKEKQKVVEVPSSDRGVQQGIVAALEEPEPMSSNAANGAKASEIESSPIMELQENGEDDLIDDDDDDDDDFAKKLGRYFS